MSEKELPLCKATAILAGEHRNGIPGARGDRSAIGQIARVLGNAVDCKLCCFSCGRRPEYSTGWPRGIDVSGGPAALRFQPPPGHATLHGHEPAQEDAAGPRGKDRQCGRLPQTYGGSFSCRRSPRSETPLTLPLCLSYTIAVNDADATEEIASPYDGIADVPLLQGQMAMCVQH